MKQSFFRVSKLAILANPTLFFCQKTKKKPLVMLFIQRYKRLLSESKMQN
ncbi:hypothetical protein HMPREF1128_0426 [Haemophilus sputorum HK 2154]|nr:hypothetical protein HMPREF1128_0426 [Haemophilus sputorum HK 2154]